MEQQAIKKCQERKLWERFEQFGSLSLVFMSFLHP